MTNKSMRDGTDKASANGVATASENQKAAHTSGPWRVVGPIGHVYATNPYGRGDMMIGQVRGWGHLTGTGGGGGCAFSEDKAIAIQEANARLIAAAPDLLAALKQSPHDMACYPSEGRHSERCLKARAAIAKAEGRS